MRIVVCIKQVPVVSALQFNPTTKTLKREGVPSEVSAFDLRAVIKAVALKAEHGGEVIVVTMGPPQARAGLVDCLALGADRGMHLCDAAFAGADTLATARALALALERLSFDLVFCGRNSVDAETGQIGPELAELLDLPQITAARTLTVDIAGRRAVAERETDDGTETISTPLPALVTAAEDLAPERFPSKAEREAAGSKPCVEVRAADLASDLALFGASGSPTRVIGLQSIETPRKRQVIDAGSADEAAAQLARLLISDHGLFGTWNVPAPASIADSGPAQVGGPEGDIWVMGERLRGSLRPVVLELLGRAVTLAAARRTHTAVVVLGAAGTDDLRTLAAAGAETILMADDPLLSAYQTEPHAAALSAAIRARRPASVLFPATSLGRDLAPRVAARLQLGLTSDCIDLGLDDQGRLLQYKPAFGGSVVAPIISRTTPEMATVRPGIFSSPPLDGSRRVVVEQLALPDSLGSRSRVVEQHTTAETAAELDHADVVVGVGKGLGDPGHLSRLDGLVRLLGAALCTTRDVTDAGWLPKQYQVGLTGRSIAPKLYVAIGIRGAFEHLVGVRRAGIIVAVNKNPKAPIFKSADYGIVGDYAAVVPALVEHLAAARSRS